MIRRGLSILLTLALVLALALSAGAAGTPTVRIETPETVKAGESFEVRIVIENNPGLSAIQFTVSYDWNAGAGLSIVLMVFVLASMALMNAFDKNGEGRVI